MKKYLLVFILFFFSVSVYAVTADKPSITAQDTPESSKFIITDVSADFSLLADVKGDDNFIDVAYLKVLPPEIADLVFKSLIESAGGAVVAKSVVPEQFDLIALLKDGALTVIPYDARVNAEDEVKQNLEAAYKELASVENVEDLFLEDQEMKAPEGYTFVPIELFAYGFTDPVLNVMNNFKEMYDEYSYFVITIRYKGLVTTPYVAVRTFEGLWLKAIVKENKDETLTLYLPAEGPVVFLEAIEI